MTRSLTYPRPGYPTAHWSAEDWTMFDRRVSWQMEQVGDSRWQAEEFAHDQVERARCRRRKEAA